MSQEYRKRIGLENLKKGDKTLLRKLLNLMGYTENKDYRINYFQNTEEMIVINPQLHKDMKVIRRTTYTKGSK